MTKQEILDGIQNVLNQGADTESGDLDLLKHYLELDIISDEKKAEDLKLKSKNDDDYIGDLESDIGRLTDMVIDLKDKIKFYETVKKENLL